MKVLGVDKLGFGEAQPMYVLILKPRTELDYVLIGFETTTSISESIHTRFWEMMR